MDGFGVWCGEGDSSANPARGDLLLAALTPVRADASRRSHLTCMLLAAWQRVVFTLAYVLELEGAPLDRVGPPQTARYADAAAGAADLAALVSVLIHSTHQRAARARHRERNRSAR